MLELFLTLGAPAASPPWTVSYLRSQAFLSRPCPTIPSRRQPSPCPPSPTRRLLAREAGARVGQFELCARGWEREGERERERGCVCVCSTSHEYSLAMASCSRASCRMLIHEHSISCIPSWGSIPLTITVRFVRGVATATATGLGGRVPYLRALDCRRGAAREPYSPRSVRKGDLGLVHYPGGSLFRSHPSPFWCFLPARGRTGRRSTK